MSLVNLGAVWLNSVEDLDDGVGFDNVTGLNLVTSTDGDVRALANGRLRMVTTTTSRRQYALLLELCSRPEIDWLEAHVAQLLCVRDDRGRKFFATYFEVNTTELIERSDYGDVSLRLTEVTYSEAV